MKEFRIVVALGFLAILCSFASDQNDTASAVLERVSAKLANTKSISYYHKRVITNPDLKESNTFEGEVYLDYRHPSSEIDCKFQFHNPEFLKIYNGSEAFYCDEISKTLTLQKAIRAQFDSDSFLNHSIYTLRKILPDIIADKNIIKSVRDTIVDNMTLTTVSFTIHDAYVETLGYLQPSAKGIAFTYRLLVDQKTDLPYQLIRQSNHDKYTVQVFFTQYKDGDDKADESWYYSNYQPEYKFIAQEKFTLVQTGATVNDWTLPLYGASKTVNLKNDYKGKFVLMEFWIRNCGYCISAVSTLNNWQKMYGKDRLAIVGVNVYDPEAEIGDFIKRNQISYPVVSKGDSLRRSLGINAYPTVVLLGPDSKVIYAGNLDEVKLEKLLKDII